MLLKNQSNHYGLMRLEGRDRLQMFFLKASLIKLLSTNEINLPFSSLQLEWYVWYFVLSYSI